MKKTLSKSKPEYLMFLCLVIYVAYVLKKQIVNVGWLDHGLKIVLFGSIIYTAVINRPYLSVIITIMLGMIFIQQSQIKKVQIVSPTPETEKEVVEETYGMYEEKFQQLSEQPTYADLKQVEEKLQSAIVTNLSNQKSLEDVEKYMITADGLTQMQNNKFSDAGNDYVSPELKKLGVQVYSAQAQMTS